MTLAESLELIGGLSEPSKMPCYSYSIPAVRCITGMKLSKVKNSICSGCYALRGNYRFPNVKNSLEKRFQSLTNPLWIEAMTIAIRAKDSSGFFRWHDSGDLQGVWHLANICQVARNLPEIKFWLPTREYGMVSEYLQKNEIPANLTVRLSALMIEGLPPKSIAARLKLTTSGVSKAGFTCPAPLQENKCLRCRACWDESIINISYKKH